VHRAPLVQHDAAGDCRAADGQIRADAGDFVPFGDRAREPYASGAPPCGLTSGYVADVGVACRQSERLVTTYRQMVTSSSPRGVCLPAGW
jgi:hypothetical protein